MGAYLRANRAKIEQALASSPQRPYFSPIFYSQHRMIVPLMARYLQGKVVDLGCGHTPYKNFMPPAVEVYHTLDYQPRVPNVTYIGDIQHMPMVASNSYDSAICFEVIEHVPQPGRALSEIYRVLKPGGVAIISVPHLSRLHEEPNDYFRFTIYGFRHLLTQANFEVVALQMTGGLFSFLGHQLSTALLTSVWPVPLLRQVIWYLNKWLVTLPCVGLDNLTNKSGIFALGYVGVVRKPLL